MDENYRLGITVGSVRRDMDEVLSRSAYERVAKIERACEEALTGGTCGVAVFDYGTYVDAHPHRHVPYGKIYWFNAETLRNGEYVWTPEEN